MATPKNKTVRLSDEQVAGLKAEAAKMAKQTKLKCGWSSLIKIAVDEFLAQRQKAKRRMATAKAS